MSRGLVACPMSECLTTPVRPHAPSQKVSQQHEQICQTSPILYRLGPFYNVLAIVKDRDQGVEPKLVSRSSVMGVEGAKKLLQPFMWRGRV